MMVKEGFLAFKCFPYFHVLNEDFTIIKGGNIS